MFIETLKENKKTLIILGILLIFVIFSSIFNQKTNSDKLDNNKDYIYTSRSNDNSKMPYINIKSEEITDANIEILTKYLEIDNKENSSMNYTYTEYSDIISLIISIIDNEGNLEKLTYNIDKKSKKILSDEEIINEFNLENSKVKNIMEYYIREYYNYEISQKYIDKSCDFNCYITEYEIDVYNNYKFYIKDNNLYIYKKINTTQDFLYDENNPFSLFEFKIS